MTLKISNANSIFSSLELIYWKQETIWCFWAFSFWAFTARCMHFVYPCGINEPKQSLESKWIKVFPELEPAFALISKSVPMNHSGKNWNDKRHNKWLFKFISRCIFQFFYATVLFDLLIDVAIPFEKIIILKGRW